jgi:hypothetical protein
MWKDAARPTEGLARIDVRKDTIKQILLSLHFVVKRDPFTTYYPAQLPENSGKGT